MKRFDRLELDTKETTSLAALATTAHAKQLDDDRDAHHWLRVASDQRRGGEHEKALRYYSRALELDRSQIAGWVGQVQMLMALEETPEAELWARKALELFKNNAELLAARAQALCRTGDLKSAQASCDAAIGQQGTYCAPWIARGELMLARREDLDEYCFDKATQIDSDWLVPLEIGCIYEHYGRATKALARTRRAVEQAPDHAYCWYRQGVCELALGLDVPAEKSFARCLQLSPKHENARARVHELARKHDTVGGILRRLFRRS